MSQVVNAGLGPTLMAEAFAMAFGYEMERPRHAYWLRELSIPVRWTNLPPGCAGGGCVDVRARSIEEFVWLRSTALFDAVVN